MNHTPTHSRNGSTGRGDTDLSNGSSRKRSITMPAVPLPPELCPTCRAQVLDWLRQYERAVETLAQHKRSRNVHLSRALAKHVAQHLRRLRKALAKRPHLGIELAKQLFEATEVSGPPSQDPHGSAGDMEVDW